MSAKKQPRPDQIYPGICLCGCGQSTRKYTRSNPGEGAFVGYFQPYIRGHSPAFHAMRPPRNEHLKGPNHPFWKGGTWVDKFGYRWVYTPDHPHHNKHYVLEHRLVVEQHLGRYLDPKEKVHHQNHDRLNNRMDNLALMSQSEHAHIHLSQPRRPRSEEHRRKLSEATRKAWAEGRM